MTKVKIKIVDDTELRKELDMGYDFLKECGSFFVLTINSDYPAGRPFGAVMEIGEDLYLSTNDMNQAQDYAAVLGEKLTRSMGRRVTVTPTEKGGSVTVEYYDNEDLESLILQLCGEAVE